MEITNRSHQIPTKSILLLTPTLLSLVSAAPEAAFIGSANRYSHSVSEVNRGSIREPMYGMQQRLFSEAGIGTKSSGQTSSRLSPTAMMMSKLSDLGEFEPQQTLQRQLQMPAADFYAAAKVYNPEEPLPAHLELFFQQSDQAMAEVKTRVSDGQMTLEQGVEFQNLLCEIGNRIINHPIIAHNHYLDRFSQGDLTRDQLKHEAQQFSVFAFQFNAAQAILIANAETMEEWYERTKLLANEMGAPYSKGFEGDLKGVWGIEHNHHIWLLNMCEDLGLSFSEIGKMRVANPGTERFVNELFDDYTSTDPSVASGATFGIENWAANNLWKSLIQGAEQFNSVQESGDKISLKYMKYHDSEEQYHSQATITELLENFSQPWFDSNKFLASAEKILTDGVRAYYEGQLETLPDKDESWPTTAC